MSRDRTIPEDTEYGRCEALARSSGDRCGRAAIGEHGKCGYHGGKTPKAIRQRLESIAIDIHRTSWVDDYFADEGLTQMRQEVVGEEKFTSEKLNLWASKIRHYNISIEKD